MSTLLIVLTLEQMECLRGESVFFQVKVQNVSDQPLPNIPTLDPWNGVLELRVSGPGGKRSAGQLACDLRAGRHRHPPPRAVPQVQRDHAGGDRAEQRPEL